MRYEFDGLLYINNWSGVQGRICRPLRTMFTGLVEVLVYLAKMGDDEPVSRFLSVTKTGLPAVTPLTSIEILHSIGTALLC